MKHYLIFVFLLLSTVAMSQVRPDQFTLKTTPTSTDEIYSQYNGTTPVRIPLANLRTELIDNFSSLSTGDDLVIFDSLDANITTTLAADDSLYLISNGSLLTGISSPSENDMVLNTAKDTLWIRQGASWIPASIGANLFNEDQTLSSDRTHEISGTSKIAFKKTGNTPIEDIFQIDENGIAIGNTTPETNYVDIRDTYESGTVDVQIANDGSSTTSHAGLYLNTEVGAGDPFVNFAASSNYSLGIDNSDSDKLKITNGANPSNGTDLLEIDLLDFDVFTDKLALSNVTGSLQLSGYGSNTFGGNDSEYILSVDASGNVQEMDSTKLADFVGVAESSTYTDSWLTAAVIAAIDTLGFCPVYYTGTGYSRSSTVHADSLNQIYVTGSNGAVTYHQSGIINVTATFSYTVGSVYYLQDNGTLSTTSDNDGDTVDYDTKVCYVIRSGGANEYTLALSNIRHFAQ